MSWRHDTLSFEHHRVAAPVEDRLDWLRKAEENNWSTRKLEAEEWRMVNKCPLGLAWVHCEKCWFGVDGDCHYREIMADAERSEEVRSKILAQLCHDIPGMVRVDEEAKDEG